MIKEELIEFEEDIKSDFLQAKIRHPVHFSSGNESPLLEIFKDIKTNDWVFSNHRNHYHALLKGIPPAWIKEQIYRGNSMHLMNSEYKFFAGAIVCGSVPIALGVAMGIKQKMSNEWVWCLVGDMAASTGIFHECSKYAARQDLPITFIIEDNDLSTNTPTRETWGRLDDWKLKYYRYERGCPHINTEEWVEFK